MKLNRSRKNRKQFRRGRLNELCVSDSPRLRSFMALFGGMMPLSPHLGICMATPPEAELDASSRHVTLLPMPRRSKSDSVASSSGLSSLVILFTTLVLIVGLAISLGWKEDQNTSRYSLLELFANSSMVWDISTTPIPITSTAALIKSIFSAHKNINDSDIPAELRHLIGEDTIRIQEVRQYINKQRFESLRSLCLRSEAALQRCKAIVDEADAEFGVTPLHLARAAGDEQSARLLLDRLGADPNRFDSAGRKPQNMSFSSFISNSKKFQRKFADCHFPAVDLHRDANALSEVRRLVFEGEPVLIRGVTEFLKGKVKGLGAELNVEQLVEANANVPVTVGEVPYASYFGLPHSQSTLRDYFTNHVKRDEEKEEVEGPLYVFQKSDDVTALGLELLSELLKVAFPVPELICPVDKKRDGDSIHFFLGAKGSGAPFHIHADAVNLVLRGSKRWFIYPPQQALYSRKHITKFLQEDYARMSEEEKPLECVQRAGDVVYIPFDWGHAVLNLEDQTFGYALEILNRREVLASLPSHHRTCA